MNIGEMFASQPKDDFHQLADHLWLYKGLFDALPDVWHVSVDFSNCEYLKYCIQFFGISSQIAACFSRKN